MERKVVHLLAKKVYGLTLGHVRPLDRLRQLERRPDESAREEQNKLKKKKRKEKKRKERAKEGEGKGK